MTLPEFRTALLNAMQENFPQATVEVEERRSVVLSARAALTQELFVEVYHNALTGKSSYALIRQGKRVSRRLRNERCVGYGTSAGHQGGL